MPDAIQHKIDGYFARIDEHVAGLPAGERKAFLLAQERRWSANLGKFLDIVAAGRPMPKAFEGADVFSFHATLAGLATRIAEAS